MNEFENGLYGKSVLTDFSPDRKVLLIAFGGLAGQLGIPVFEFYNLASQLSVNKMFIRDLNLAWYQKGLKNTDIKDIDDMVIFLKQKVAELGPEKVIVVGNSAGGFAALLFGNLINADVVHSFAPQTFIDNNNRRLHSDLRFNKHIEELYNSQVKEDYFDLVKVFENNKSNKSTMYNIYYDVNFRIDRIHSERMERFNHVHLHQYSVGGHSVINHIKESGELLEIIRNSCL